MTPKVIIIRTPDLPLVIDDTSKRSCAGKAGFLCFVAMKFAAAIIANLFIGWVLAIGILSAVKGTYWILAAALVAYVLTFAFIGCLPKKSHHH